MNIAQRIVTAVGRRVDESSPICDARLKDGSRVNVIAPVMGVTGMLGDFMGVPDTPENRARFIATIPLGRLAVPQDIANVALFLASDEAAFLTGVELPVDGGRTV